MLAQLKAAPPWSWAAVAGVVGVVFLVWHRYANDMDDTSWIDVDQPPAAADFPLLPACGPAHGGGRPMGGSGCSRPRQPFGAYLGLGGG